MGNVIQTLWIGERLSLIEQVCLRSFLAHGYSVHLYSYGDIRDVPPGVHLLDANEIVPADRVFYYPKTQIGAGSPAGFANLFRYRLLSQRGGWWIDTDVLCQRRLPYDRALSFGLESDTYANNCVLRAPPRHDLFEALSAKTEEAGTDFPWGTTGPKLLTGLARSMGYWSEALPQTAFCPIDYLDWRSVFDPNLTDRVSTAVSASYTVHLWNEMMRRSDFAKDGPFEEGSFFVNAARLYGVSVPVTQRRAASGLAHRAAPAHQFGEAAY